MSDGSTGTRICRAAGQLGHVLASSAAGVSMITRPVLRAAAAQRCVGECRALVHGDQLDRRQVSSRFPTQWRGTLDIVVHHTGCSPCTAKWLARLVATVVLPDPPFGFSTTMRCIKVLGLPVHMSCFNVRTGPAYRKPPAPKARISAASGWRRRR